MAYGLPGARFVGVELAARPVEVGRELAHSLGLSNVDLQRRDILDIPEDLGEFDYIVAHGVYSWVPKPVRDAVMSVLARHLAPDGIAYLNFNALPGGHLRNLARDLMQFRLSVFDDPEAHGEDALRFVRLVAGAQPDASPYRRILEEEIGRFENNPISVLFHDDLVPAHRAFHFRNVVDHAAQHGLRYLCEARPADVHPGRYPESIQAAINRFGGGRIAREQCFDFLVCQMYRCSLFCREGLALAPIRELDGMHGLRVAAELLPATTPADLTDGIGGDVPRAGRHERAPRRFGREGGAGDPRRALARQRRNRAGVARRAQACRPTRAAHAARTPRIRRVPRHEPRNGIRRPPHLGATSGDSGRRTARRERTRAHRDRAWSPGHQPAPSPGGDRRPDCRRGPCTPRRHSGYRGALRGGEPGVARCSPSASSASNRHFRDWRTTACWKADRVARSIERRQRSGAPRTGLAAISCRFRAADADLVLSQR